MPKIVYSSGEEWVCGGRDSASIYGCVCVSVKPSVDGIFSPDVLCIVYSVYMYCT